MKKISLLKEVIDKKYDKEPLAKLRKKMEQNNIKFSLKTVTEKTVTCELPVSGIKSLRKNSVWPSNTLHGNTWTPPTRKPTWILLKRSTMTALSSMQQEWILNSVNKLKTSILLWDLSAAYDTLCPSLFCEKLKIYGFDKYSCKWFVSFLTGCSKRVKIGNSISKSMKLVSGVPQGGILCPIFFIIYGADMEEWYHTL